MDEALTTSRALWNRTHLALESDEMLAQLLDRGELSAWRALYRLARAPTPEAAELRRRIVRICMTVPIGFPHLFLSAMAHLGETVGAPPPPDSFDL